MGNKFFSFKLFTSSSPTISTTLGIQLPATNKLLLWIRVLLGLTEGESTHWGWVRNGTSQRRKGVFSPENTKESVRVARRKPIIVPPQFLRCCGMASACAPSLGSALTSPSEMQPRCPGTTSKSLKPCHEKPVPTRTQATSLATAL